MMMKLRFRPCMTAAALMIALAGFSRLVEAQARELRLFNTIKRGGWAQIHEGISQVRTSDIWDPHNASYQFDPAYLSDRLDTVAPWYLPDQVILADVERLTYPDGNVVDYETPEDFLLAITNIKLFRPDQYAGIDGGLSLSWAQLLAKDENGYRHHDEWREDAQPWRPAIEAADYWTMSMYRDGETQQDWIERLRVFRSLFREQFPGKPLMIMIWHRERIGAEREEVWISMRDYVHMGLVARNLGCHVVAFGRETDDENYDRAMSYFDRLAREW